jgi:anti-anti-sigma factor
MPPPYPPGRGRTALRDHRRLRRLFVTPFPDVLSGALRGGETLQEGRVAYVLKGELDMAGGESLVRRVTELAASTTGRIDIDMEEVAFIDSSGVRALLRLHEAAVSSGRSMSVRNLTPDVRRLLDLIGVTELLTVR